MFSVLDNPSQLQLQTIDAYNDAVAPGTAANRLRQARFYLTFCVLYGVNYLYPSRLDVAMYVKYFANTHRAPNTVKNYLSGARHWVNFHIGSDSSFAAPEACAIVKSVVDNSRHVPTQAYPLSPADIRIICTYIDSHPETPPAFKPAIFVGYICFLRASNILSPSVLSWGGPHTLHVSDISLFPSGPVPSLNIAIRSTKTRKPSKPFVLNVFAAPDHCVCPVRAWENYVNALNPWPLGPAFLLDNATPLTSQPLVTFIRAALQASGFKHHHRVTLHSLRRGAAQAAQRAGVSLSDIKLQGTWASDSGVRPYLSK